MKCNVLTSADCFATIVKHMYLTCFNYIPAETTVGIHKIYRLSQLLKAVYDGKSPVYCEKYVAFFDRKNIIWN